MFYSVEETTSSLLFGQLGFRDHDGSSYDGASMLTLVWVAAGSQWMAARRQYVSGCRHPLFPTCVAALAGSLYRRSGLFRQLLFPHRLENVSSSPDYMMRRPAYGFDLRTKGTLPDFHWFSGELTYEQYYGDKVDLLGNGTLSRSPRRRVRLCLESCPLGEVQERDIAGRR